MNVREEYSFIDKEKVVRYKPTGDLCEVLNVNFFDRSQIGLVNIIMITGKFKGHRSTHYINKFEALMIDTDHFGSVVHDEIEDLTEEDRRIIFSEIERLTKGVVNG